MSAAQKRLLTPTHIRTDLQRWQIDILLDSALHEAAEEIKQKVVYSRRDGRRASFSEWRRFHVALTAMLKRHARMYERKVLVAERQRQKEAKNP